MKLSRIRFAFPWRIALMLGLLPCLPLLGFWAWFQWEVPPLQRYYLAAYWHSSETANQSQCSDSNPMAHGDGSGP